MAVDQLGLGFGDSAMDLGLIAFTTYVSKIGSYDKTYGSLGAVIILLLWFYLTAYVILFGAELNAEIGRQSPAGEARPLAADSGTGEALRRRHP